MNEAMETVTIMAVMVVIPIPWILSLVLLEPPRDHFKLISNSLNSEQTILQCIDIS